MPTESVKVYEFDPLDKYPRREQLTIRLADILFFTAIRAIGSTIRWQVDGEQHLDSVTAAGKIPIYCLWHDRIFAGTYFLRDRGIVVITSQSKDGEYIARFLKRLGYGTIRGSSTRGGTRALVEMIREMRSGKAMAFTVDGPRGPRHEVKMGAVMLAKKTGNPMLPFSVECEKFWTIGSWDRLQIPRPFTRARFVFAPPIYVRADIDEDELNEKRDELQRSLESIALERD